MSEFELLKFYATAAHPCSYLEGQEATTLFVDPETICSTEQLVKLAQSGFRRSGRYLYKPNCGACTACVSVRLPTSKFRLKKRQTRTIKRNLDIKFSTRTPILDQEHYALYERYINTRHSDGDMFPPSRSQYESFLVQNDENSFFLEARLENNLIAVTLFDEIPGDGLSAIYTFFDPNPIYDRRSLGRLMILQMIEVAQRMDLPYVYLGYWIRDSKKMAYKTEYRPIEMLINCKWIQVD